MRWSTHVFQVPNLISKNREKFPNVLRLAIWNLRTSLMRMLEKKTQKLVKKWFLVAIACFFELCLHVFGCPFQSFRMLLCLETFVTQVSLNPFLTIRDIEKSMQVRNVHKKNSKCIWSWNQKIRLIEFVTFLKICFKPIRCCHFWWHFWMQRKRKSLQGIRVSSPHTYF